MQEPLLIQLRHESNSYKRLARFMSDETVFMKHRLTEVLQYDFESDLLDSFEYFQNEFLKTDEVVGYIRNNISELDRCIAEDGNSLKTAKAVRSGLCKKTLLAIDKFHDLQIKFNDFLLVSSEKLR